MPSSNLQEAIRRSVEGARHLLWMLQVPQEYSAVGGMA